MFKTFVTSSSVLFSALKCLSLRLVIIDNFYVLLQKYPHPLHGRIWLEPLAAFRNSILGR